MVAEVNKIIAGELLNHRSVVIPGVGTLYVAHRGARRLSRQKIAAPRNEIDFRPSEEGVSQGATKRRRRPFSGVGWLRRARARY